MGTGVKRVPESGKERPFDVITALLGLLRPWRAQLVLSGVAIVVSTAASLVPPCRTLHGHGRRAVLRGAIDISSLLNRRHSGLGPDDRAGRTVKGTVPYLARGCAGAKVKGATRRPSHNRYGAPSPRRHAWSARNWCGESRKAHPGVKMTSGSYDPDYE